MKKILFFFALILISSSANAAVKKAYLKQGLHKPYIAPEISGIYKWYNGSAIRMADLRNRIVLVTFWNYSKPQSLRAIPHIEELNYKYSAQGLTIIAVHVPEFEFEKVPQNVDAVIAKYYIKYIIALDNDQITKNNFKSDYVPSYYLINKIGNVVYEQYNSEKYDFLENNIRALLGLDEISDVQEKEVPAEEMEIITPQLYFGAKKSENNANTTTRRLEFPKNIPLHYWAMQGDWRSTNQFIESNLPDDALRIRFYAKKVWLTMSSASGATLPVAVKLNNKQLTNDNSGVDVKNSGVNVQISRPYEVISQEKAEEGILEISSPDIGLRAYTVRFDD